MLNESKLNRLNRKLLVKLSLKLKKNEEDLWKKTALQRKKRNAALVVKVPFKSSKHPEKVMKKKKILPSSPSKKQFVVKSLFESLYPASKKSVTAPIQTGKELSEEMKKCVQELSKQSKLKTYCMQGKKRYFISDVR